MWRFIAAVSLGFLCAAHETSAQDSEVDVALTRGTTGLGLHLISEGRGRGAVVGRVVPESAASLVLRAGDVVTTVAGVEIRQWSLDNIQRLLETQGRVNIKIRRRAEATPEPQLYNSENYNNERYNSDALRVDSQPQAVSSCYATIEGDTEEEVHALECTQATLGSDLPTFATTGGDYAFPLMVAEPLEHCKDEPSLNASGHALLVSRGGCLPHVKARNAARRGAEVLYILDGQLPPFPPLPRVAGKQFSLSPVFARPSAQKVDIPVVVIRNETGHRILEEIRETSRSLVLFSHAGGRPSRFSARPRNQLPLTCGESLHPAKDPFDLTNAFRDGEMGLTFGTPGLPGGEVATMHLQVAYELSHVLTGLKETIFFNRGVRCPVCNGRGAPGSDMRPCKTCSASAEPGTSSVSHEHSHEVKQTLRTTCSSCHGFGEVPKKGSACPRCKGDRVIHERASLEINIPPGAPDSHTLRFPGIGSQFPGKSTGKVEVVAKVNPHEQFARDGANLRGELNISVIEALSGFTRDIHLLNGTTISLNKTGVREECTLAFPGSGANESRGSVGVIIELIDNYPVTNDRDDIEISGGGLPFWDPSNANSPASDNGRNDSCSPNHTTSTRPDNCLEDDAQPSLGSMFLTCNIVFPDTMGRGRVQSAPPWNVTSNQC